MLIKLKKFFTQPVSPLAAVALCFMFSVGWIVGNGDADIGGRLSVALNATILGMTSSATNRASCIAGDAGSTCVVNFPGAGPASNAAVQPVCNDQTNSQALTVSGCFVDAGVVTQCTIGNLKGSDTAQCIAL